MVQVSAEVESGVEEVLEVGEQGDEISVETQVPSSFSGTLTIIFERLESLLPLPLITPLSPLSLKSTSCLLP